MRYLRIGAVFLFAFLVQPSLLNVINVSGYTPNLILCMTVLYTFLYEDDIYGVVFGALFGVLYDMMYSNVIGPMPISLVLVAIGIVVVREFTNIENIINMWAVSLVSVFAYYFINWGLHYLAGNPVGFSVVLHQIPQIAAFSLVIITVMYFILIKRVIRHHKDRYVR